MADRGAGKARGRSRARGPGQPETTRRPGQPPVQPAQPDIRRPGQSAQAAAAAPVQPPAPVGRVARGTAHVDSGAIARPGDAVASVSADLAALSLKRGDNGDGNGNGARGGGRGAWRGRESRDPVTRPPHVTDKRGEAGQPCTVIANYFALTSKPDWVIFQYHVAFSPDVDNPRLRRGLLHEHKEVLGVYLFDGAILFKLHRLEQNETTVCSKNRTTEETITIIIKLTKEVGHKDPIVMQIMDIQMRKNMRAMNYKMINRMYYDQAGEKKTDSGRFRVWPGFSTAIHQYDNGVMMCADLCFKLLRNDSVLDQLMAMFQRDRAGYRDTAMKELVGCIVLTRYNSLTYRIDDILWDLNPQSTFLKNGEPVRYLDYYEQHWNLKINDHRQPLLVSNPKKSDIKRGVRTEAIMLVPEFCIMTGISDEMRSDFNVMRDIATHTRVGPNDRHKEINGFMSRMLGNEAVRKNLSDWDLSFKKELVSFPARVQKPETIFQDGCSFDYQARAADWSQGMRGKKLLTAINIEKYVLIATQRDMQAAMQFIDVLYKVCGPMGIEVAYPVEVPLNGNRPNDYVQALERCVQPEIQLAICVVPNRQKDRYDAIKKTCCISRPVASQVILANTISKPQMLMSVATKIGIQLNCKLGGSAWAVQIPIKNLMVIGYDSYHDSSKRGLSVGAICCSFNDRLTQYYSRVTFQTSKQEMMDGLKINIVAALRHYQNVNKFVPDRIIVYRDGVGEGQLGSVKEFELEQIKSCFKEVGPNFSPRLTFIVVNKRITTRIFSKENGGVGNPIPGTIIDSVITRPEFYDFFLVSQSVRQGTVTPTQYNVIHDEGQIKPDHLQRLTYKLTHLYYNWPGTIRVPAPCLYAHKLAFLTGQSLHSNPNEKLIDTLFFL